jgi:hypothetical protein
VSPLPLLLEQCERQPAKTKGLNNTHHLKRNVPNVQVSIENDLAFQEWGRSQIE